MYRWGILVGLEEDTILQAQMLFHCVRSVCCTLAFTSYCGYCVSYDYGRTIKKYSGNTDIHTEAYPYAVWTDFEIQMDPDTQGRYTFQVRWMRHDLMWW